MILAAIIIGFCFANGMFDAKVEVPDFIGMNYYSDILNQSAYSEFNIKVDDSVEADGYAQGEVYKQSPSARVKIRPREQITVFIPKMRDNSEVPDVYTYAFTDAITMIESAGFKYVLEYEKNSDAPEKTVIRTNPERFTKAEKGSTVVLYVSAESDTVSVPKIVGYDAQLAQELVESAGLEFEISAEENSTEKENVVLRIANYREDTEVPKGTVISVVVSNGKPLESKAKVSFRLPDTGTDGSMKVYLANELISAQSKTLLLDGSTHSMEITGSDDEKKLIVKIDDSTYYECKIDFTQSPAVVSDEKTYSYSPSEPGGASVFGRASLPAVEGMTYAEAYDALSSAGFTNIRRYDVSTAEPSKDEIVFQQSPPYKAFVRYNLNTEITLSVYTYGE